MHIGNNIHLEEGKSASRKSLATSKHAQLIQQRQQTPIKQQQRYQKSRY